MKPKAVVFLLSLLFVSCAYSNEYMSRRNTGYSYFNSAQKYISKDYYESIEPYRPIFIDLSNIKGVWVCPDNSCMPKACRDVNATGCASFGIIYINGPMINGKIFLNEAVLGHELMHILNYRTPIIANPDKIKDLIR